jgi:hypothetical protein
VKFPNLDLFVTSFERIVTTAYSWQRTNVTYVVKPQMLLIFHMRPETYKCSSIRKEFLLSISKQYVTTLSIAAMNEWVWSTGGINDTGRGKSKWSKKTLSHCHIVHHEFHTVCLVLPRHNTEMEEITSFLYLKNWGKPLNILPENYCAIWNLYNGSGVRLRMRSILYRTLPFAASARLCVSGRDRHGEGERSRWVFSAASI